MTSQALNRPVDVLAEWANDTSVSLEEANRRAATYNAVAELIEACKPLAAFSAIDPKGTMLEGRDPCEAQLLYDHKSGRCITLGNLLDLAAAIAAIGSAK